MDPITLAALISAAATLGSSAIGPGGIRGLFGKSETLTEPYIKPSNQAFANLAEQLKSGKGMISDNPIYKAAQDRIQKILGGQTQQELLAPLMTQFQREVLPTLAHRVGGAGMNRASSAWPSYLARAYENLGQNALQTQAQSQLQALPYAAQLAALPGAQQASLFEILNKARGTTYPEAAVPSGLANVIGGLSAPLNPQGESQLSRMIAQFQAPAAKSSAPLFSQPFSLPQYNLSQARATPYGAGGAGYSPTSFSF